MEAINQKFSLDLEEFFAQWGKVSETLGKVDDSITKLSRKNPLAGAASMQVQFNQQLGMQVQIYQRVEAAAASYNAEQGRIKRIIGEIKSAQKELAAADQYGDLKKKIGQVETALEKLEDPLKKVDSWWDKLKAKFSKGLSIPKIDSPGLPKVDTPSGKLNSNPAPKASLLKGAAGAAAEELAGAVGVSLSVAGGVAAAGAIIVKSTKDWAEYGKKLSEVSAITGATGKALEFLDDTALQIEADTGIAGTTILDAFKSIGSIKPELLESNEALAQTTKEVIALSQASGLDLQQAAISLLGSINQFGEGADQAGRFANVLAAGAKYGASEINETSEALKNSGTAMKAAGVSFEQGNALVQSLAGVMIKGSEAGTALRNVLLKLETASDKNLRPSVVGLDAALENASQKYKTTTDLTKAFGVENIVAARRVLDTREEIVKMTKDITGTSIAYEQAKTNTDNLATDLDKAGSSITAFFRSLGASQDGFLRTSVQLFTSFVNSLSSKTGVLKAFFSEVFSFQGLASPSLGIANGIKAAYEQRQANLKAEARKQLVDGITAEATKSVADETKKLEAQYQQQGLTVPKAQRAAAAKQKEERDAEYESARADHNRLRKEFEGATATQKTQFDKQFADSRKRILAAQVAKKKADSEVARLAKSDAERAAALKSALGEGPTDEQKKEGKKALDTQNEINRLLLDAREDYAKEVQKLESEYGKNRLEALRKDGEEYINLRAEIEQKELQVQRDAIEKKLQLAKSNKTVLVNGKRQVVADTSITLDNSAPMIAQMFNDRQKQIEDERARQVQLSRIRQEYQLLELAKKSNETELQLFDKFWEEKLLIEKKNTETYDSLLSQREGARKIIAATGSKQEIAEFEKAWDLILANEEKNTAVYKAMVAKRNRDRNALTTDLILKQVKDQEEIETKFVDTNQFEKNLRTDDPSLNADDVTTLREQAKLAIRKKYAEETLKLLKEQGAAENAVLITSTQAAIDTIEKQQRELTNSTPKSRDIYELLGITDGMNDEQLKAFRDGMAQIGEAIQSTTRLIIEQSDEKIQALDAQISAKEQQISIEEQRDKEGYANNLATRRAELNDLKRQKAEEESVRKKALAVQQTIDAATAISNQAVAISEGIRFLTSYASRSAALGPIAGPIAYFATVASILASIYAVTQQFKSIVKLRQGGRLKGASHEQGGIRGTGAFGDVEVEGGEHVTNKQASERFDKTLQALNRNDPRQAIQELVREGRIGLPGVVVAHIKQPNFGSQKNTIDLSVLTAEVRDHKEVTKVMLNYMKAQGSKTQMTSIAPGVIVEQQGDNVTYNDMRKHLKKLGIDVG